MKTGHNTIGHRSLGSVARDMWFVAGIITAITCGVLWPEAGIRAKETGFIRWAVALMIFLSGLSVGTEKLFNELRNIKAIVFSLFFIYVLFPAVTYVVARVFFPEKESFVGMMIMAAQGTTLSSAVVITAVAGANVALSLVIVVASGCLTSVLTPVVLSISLSTVTNVELLPMMKLMAASVLLPVAVSQAVRQPIKGFIEKNHRALSSVSQVVILAIILVAVSTSSGRLGPFVRRLPAMAACIVLLHAVMLSMTYKASGLIARDPESKTAISFCSSQKTLVAGMLIWERYFSDIAFSAVPLILYHVVQLAMDSVIASRKGANDRACQIDTTGK